MKADDYLTRLEELTLQIGEHLDHEAFRCEVILHKVFKKELKGSHLLAKRAFDQFAPQVLW